MGFFGTHEAPSSPSGCQSGVLTPNLEAAPRSLGISGSVQAWALRSLFVTLILLVIASRWDILHPSLQSVPFPALLRLLDMEDGVLFRFPHSLGALPKFPR